MQFENYFEFKIYFVDSVLSVSAENASKSTVLEFGNNHF